MNKLINWLLPKYCLCCHDICPTGISLCPRCLPNLPWQFHNNQELLLGSPAIILFHYEAIITRFIMQLKFQKKLYIANLLGNLLAEKIQYQQCIYPQAIIPVPLHNKRLRERGFNQSLEIAKPISKALKIPIITKGVKRAKFTLPQATLKSKARYNNVRNAFICEKPLSINHVAIVDDVITTGQTIKELINTLNNNGIKQFQIWCTAKAQ